MKLSTEQHGSHGLLGCPPGSIGRYVLLPGDPGRVPMIAELFEDAEEVSRTREFCAYTGTLQGEKGLCRLHRDGRAFYRHHGAGAGSSWSTGDDSRGHLGRDAKVHGGHRPGHNLGRGAR